MTNSWKKLSATYRALSEEDVAGEARRSNWWHIGAACVAGVALIGCGGSDVAADLGATGPDGVGPGQSGVQFVLDRDGDGVADTATCTNTATGTGSQTATATGTCSATNTNDESSASVESCTGTATGTGSQTATATDSDVCGPDGNDDGGTHTRTRTGRGV